MSDVTFTAPRRTRPVAARRVRVRGFLAARGLGLVLLNR